MFFSNFPKYPLRTTSLNSRNFSSCKSTTRIYHTTQVSKFCLPFSTLSLHCVLYKHTGDFKRRLLRTPSTGTMSSADDLDEREPPSPTGVSNVPLTFLPARRPACVFVCVPRACVRACFVFATAPPPPSTHVPLSRQGSVGLLSLSQMHSSSLLQLLGSFCLHRMFLYLLELRRWRSC